MKFLRTILSILLIALGMQVGFGQQKLFTVYSSANNPKKVVDTYSDCDVFGTFKKVVISTKGNGNGSYGIKDGLAEYFQTIGFSANDIRVNRGLRDDEVDKCCEVLYVTVKWSEINSVIKNVTCQFVAGISSEGIGNTDQQFCNVIGSTTLPKNYRIRPSGGYIPQSPNFMHKHILGHMLTFCESKNNNPSPDIVKHFTNFPSKRYLSEELIKQDIDVNDPVQGIFKTLGGHGESAYKVACLKIDGQYKMLYLSGASNANDWELGELKAELTKTSKPYYFLGNWYGAYKQLIPNCEIQYYVNEFVLKLNGGASGYSKYIRLYPTETDYNTSSSTKTVSSGTGFALAQGGYIVTNHHVITGAKQIKVKGIKGDFNKAYAAVVVAADKNNDIAIIKIDDEKFNSLGTIPYNINNGVAQVGSNVFALGYPLRSSMGEEIKLTNGIISSGSGFQNDITTYQSTIALQPGNSGGPIFDNTGNVVGIACAKHSQAENASYLVKSPYLYTMAVSAGVKLPTQPKTELNNKPLPEIVKHVKGFVYIIESTE